MPQPSNDLHRYVQAQEPVYAAVCAQLSAGRKTSHWMWFVFPQLRQLGRSSMARHFGLQDRHEAAAYWHHPVLGPRLLHCTELVLAVPGTSALDIFGPPDDMKFGSCMTLFDTVAPAEPAFHRALQRFFGARRDPLTLQLLAV